MQQQPHTETDIEHTDGQQDTGNHYRPEAQEAGGPDRLGGTRAGAGNVERVVPDEAESAGAGTKAGSTSGSDAVNASEPNPGGAGSVERAPGCDERGRR